MAVYRWEVLCRVQKYPLNDLPRSAVNAPYGQSGGFRSAYRDVPIISCATFYDREQRDPGEAFENRRDRQNARLALISLSWSSWPIGNGHPLSRRHNSSRQTLTDGEPYRAPCPIVATLGQYPSVWIYTTRAKLPSSVLGRTAARSTKWLKL